MTEEEKLLKTIEEAVNKASNGKIDKATLDKELATINAEIAKLTSEKIDKLAADYADLTSKYDNVVSASKDQGTELAKLKAGQIENVKPKGFVESIKEALMAKKGLLTEVNDDYGQRLSFKKYFEENKASGPIEINKIAVDMLQSNIAGNYVNNIRLTQLDPQRVGIPLAPYPHALDVVPTKPIAKPYMSLLVVGTYTDGSATKTEGNSAGQSSFLLTTVEFKAFNIAAYFTISDETLDDLDEVLAEIAVTAPDKLHDAIDAKIFADAGNGSTDIRGLFVNGATCTDFVASTYSGTVPGANLVDLIEKMKLTGRKAKYKMNIVGLNADDISKFNGLKDQIDNSIMDRRLVFNAMGELVSICGLAVIENDSITTDTCFVGDSRMYQIGLRKGMSLEIGLNSDDFVDFRKTARLSVRLAFGVRDKAAFIYSSGMAADVNTLATV